MKWELLCQWYNSVRPMAEDTYVDAVVMVVEPGVAIVAAVATVLGDAVVTMAEVAEPTAVIDVAAVITARVVATAVVVATEVTGAVGVGTATVIIAMAVPTNTAILEAIPTTKNNDAVMQK